MLMRSTMIILLAVMSQADPGDRHVERTRGTQNSMDLMDKLLDRSLLRASPLQSLDLDDATLEKSGHFAPSPCMSSGSACLSPHTRATLGGITRARTNDYDLRFRAGGASSHFMQQQHLPSFIRGAIPVPLHIRAAHDERKGIYPKEETNEDGRADGPFKALASNIGTLKPQDLFKKYGIAYLATSITLSTLSYATCYLLISKGVNVAGLLLTLGIQATRMSSTVSTAALAYAAHKAASPIRFVPTVVLTPFIAGLLGKKEKNDEEYRTAP